MPWALQKEASPDLAERSGKESSRKRKIEKKVKIPIGDSTRKLFLKTID